MNKYINFLILKHEFFKSQNFSLDVDLKAQRLMELIAIHNEIGQPMNVGEAMALDKLGSPACLHRKINDLRIAGLIQMIYKENNRRTKYIIPTDTTNEYLKIMGNMLIDAIYK